MINKIEFIHLSDLHISKNNVSNVIELKNGLINDLKNILNSEEDILKFIVFTGDLIMSGEENDLFFKGIELFIEPICKELKIDTQNNFLFVPGNHEVDLSKLNKDFQNSFTERILTEGVDNENFSNHNISSKLTNVYNFIDLFYKWDSSKLIIDQIREYNNYKIGFSLINTAWNSNGNSKNDAKKIVLSRDHLIQSYENIKNCNLKVCLMHHPIDWFYDDNAALIEPLLSQYDLVLTGHKHHCSPKCEQHMNQITIFNAASKLTTKDQENGYSKISYDLQEKKVIMHNRVYNTKRCKFVPNTSISDDGIKEYNIKEKNQKLQLLSNIILNTRKNFFKTLDKLFVINILEENSDKKFEEIFVTPSLFSESEYKKENNDDLDNIEEIDLNDLLKQKTNLTFWGKKEIGKTILAHYIAKYYYDNYMEKKVIPIIVDCRKITEGKNSLFNYIYLNLNNLCDENHSITKNQVKEIIQSNNIILIFDNYDNESKKYTSIKSFVDENNYIRYIYFRNENPIIFSDEDKESLSTDEESKSKNIYIRSMDKNKIRELAQNLLPINNCDFDFFINQIVNSFATNNLPRTPLAVSLVMAICNEKSDFLPTNQSVIVEQFMEKLLEKLNREEIYAKTYDFKNKEKFLSSIAYEMHNKRRFFLSEIEFNDFTIKYHVYKGYNLKDSKFDRLFFEKGVLVKNEGNVYFRFECIIYYYLAKYCISNKKFLDEITKKENYINYGEVLNYYSGIVRDDIELIEKISNYLEEVLNHYQANENLLEVDSIKLQLKYDENEIKSKLINDNKLTQKEKDKISDKKDYSNNYNPKNIQIEKNKSDTFSFDYGIEILGKILRNSEEIDLEKKIFSFNIFLKGVIKIWHDFKTDLLKFAEEINEKIIERAIKKEEKDNKEELEKEIKEEMKKAFSLFSDFIKLSVPLSLSNFIYETIGIEKLNILFENRYNELDYNTPEKFLILMLLCDMKNENWKKYIDDFIKYTRFKPYQWMVFIKLQYFFQFNYFGDETDKLIESIANNVIVINEKNNMDKSKIMETIKKDNNNKNNLLKQLKMVHS